MDPRPSFIETVVNNQTDWFELMVLCCFGLDADFRVRCLPVIGIDARNGKLIEEFSTPVDNAVFLALRRYAECVGSRNVPPMPMSFAEVFATQMAQTGNPIGFSDIPDVLARWQQASELNLQASTPMVKEGLAYWLKKQRTQKLVMEHTQLASWNPDVLQQDIQRSLNAVMSMDGKQTFWEFGHGLDNQVLDIHRTPISLLPTLSKAMGGGLGRTESTLFVAAQGAGKTICATQISADLCVHSGQTGVIVTTEQPSHELEPRIVASICQIPYDRIKDSFDVKVLLPHERALYENLRANTKNKLFFENWNDDDRARSIATDLKDVIHRRQDQIGKHIDFITLDWIGGALGKLSLGDSDKMRHIYQMCADTFCQVVEAEDMYGLAFAQAHPADGINNAKVGAKVISECKSMGREFTNVVGITAMLEKEQNIDAVEANFSKRQSFYFEKARKGAGGRAPFVRDFEYQRMSDPFKK